MIPATTPPMSPQVELLHHRSQRLRRRQRACVGFSEVQGNK
jgi:hypothetical protein